MWFRFIQKSEQYQVFNEALQLFLSEQHCLLSAHDGDALLLRFVGRREDDASSSPIAHTPNVRPSPANQELVVLRLGLELY